MQSPFQLNNMKDQKKKVSYCVTWVDLQAEGREFSGEGGCDDGICGGRCQPLEVSDLDDLFDASDIMLDRADRHGVSTTG